MNHISLILLLAYLLLGSVWAQYSVRWAAKIAPNAVTRIGSLRLLIIIALETFLWPLALAGHFYMRRKFGIRA